MCGIFGIIDFNYKNDYSKELNIMNRKLIHRGPDDEGEYISNDKKVWLGHRRLAIIDLSERGHQPMKYMNRYIITFNGEIYNYIELREFLKNKKYIFKTNTDTEVILAAYDYWGEDCVNKFNGMWAFVIYDKYEKNIFASRDRYGIKPFYYIYIENKFFAFASEVKALVAAFNNFTGKDIEKISAFLKTSKTDHDNTTFFKNIKQLLKSNNIVIKDNKLKIKQYYLLRKTFISNNIYNNIEKTKILLIDSIEKRFRSDVEVGSCLSGGIDSSSIVSVAVKKLNKTIHTFSAIYNIKGYSEKQYIDEIIKYKHIIPHKVYPLPKKFWDTIEQIIYYQDEPFASYGAYSQWYVMKKAKENGIKVLLDGQGADEVFGGYFSYFISLLHQLFKEFSNHPVYVLESIFNWKNLIPYQKLFRNILFALKQYIMLSNNINIKKSDNPLFDVLTNRLYKSVFDYGLQSLLHFEDRNSMAHSIEARVPFLDYRLVELAFNIPFHHKIYKGTTKYVLRKAMKDIIPDKIYYRKNKLGYPTPIIVWFRKYFNKEINIYLMDNKDIFRDLSKEYNIKHLQYLFNNSDNDISYQLWKWIVVKKWYNIKF